jgi:pimeloyl-ACP methyl ester carboxylesterase
LVITGAPLLRTTVMKKPAMRYRIIRQLSNWHLVSDRAMEAARSRYGSADYNTASGMLREILVTVVNETFEEELAAITCPVELVWGEHDTAVPLEVARQSLAKLSTATLTVLPGVDHDTIRHAPEALAEAFERLS